MWQLSPPGHPKQNTSLSAPQLAVGNSQSWVGKKTPPKTQELRPFLGNSKTPRVRAACELSAVETRTRPQSITLGLSARAPGKGRGAPADRRVRKARAGSSGGRCPRSAATVQTWSCTGEGTPSATAGLVEPLPEETGISHRVPAGRSLDSPRSRAPAAARRGGKGEVLNRVVGAGGWRPGGMKLHCEVEVVSRHLPALGLRNRGKGVRAVLSLCQQAPRTPPGPRAGGERGGRHPACLFISTLKDRRGTRYEVRGAGGSGVAARRSCPTRPTVSPAGLRLGGCRASGP